MGVCASNSAALFTKLYELDESTVLSQGSYATVFQGRHKRTREPVVIKRIDKSSAADDARGSFWEDEAATMQQCTPHPHIVELLHLYESPTHVFLVTEFASGGELFEALISEGAYSEWDAKRFTRDIFEALARIHDQQIVHRDIKPENLLLTSKDPKVARIKLGDFGAAMPLHGTSYLSCAQLTWAYCAPELLRERLAMASSQSEPSTSETMTVPVKAKVANPSASPKSDVWSVGIVLYVLLSGIHPFDPDGRQTKDQIISSILSGKYSLTEPQLWTSEISGQAKALLRLLLSADPAQRPTARDALSHAWFHDATTPRLALQVSTTKGLGVYQLAMQKKFRTSVRVAMAAQSMRRSLHRIRTVKTTGSTSGSRLPSLEIPQDEEIQEAVAVVPAPAPFERGELRTQSIPEVSPPTTPMSRLFGRTVVTVDTDVEEDKRTSEQQSIDLIDEFDGDGAAATATRPPQLVD